MDTVDDLQCVVSPRQRRQRAARPVDDAVQYRTFRVALRLQALNQLCFNVLTFLTHITSFNIHER